MIFQAGRIPRFGRRVLGHLILQGWETHANPERHHDTVDPSSVTILYRRHARNPKRQANPIFLSVGKGGVGDWIQIRFREPQAGR